jgi:hypothetical protein
MEYKTVVRLPLPALDGKTDVEALEFFRKKIGEPTYADTPDENGGMFFEYEDGTYRPVYDCEVKRWGVDKVLAHETEEPVFFIRMTTTRLVEVEREMRDKFDTHGNVFFLSYSWYNGVDEPITVHSEEPTEPTLTCSECKEKVPMLFGTVCTRCTSKTWLKKLEDEPRPRFHVTLLCPYCKQDEYIRTVHTDIMNTQPYTQCRRCGHLVHLRPGFYQAAERIWLEEDLIAETPEVTGNPPAVDLHQEHTKEHQQWVDRVLTEGKKAGATKE